MVAVCETHLWHVLSVLKGRRPRSGRWKGPSPHIARDEAPIPQSTNNEATQSPKDAHMAQWPAGFRASLPVVRGAVRQSHARTVPKNRNFEAKRPTAAVQWWTAPVRSAPPVIAWDRGVNRFAGQWIGRVPTIVIPTRHRRAAREKGRGARSIVDERAPAEEQILPVARRSMRYGPMSTTVLLGWGCGASDPEDTIKWRGECQAPPLDGDGRACTCDPQQPIFCAPVGLG